MELISENIIDYPVETQIYHCTLYPLLADRCTCGKQYAVYQRLIESELGKSIEKYRKEGLSYSAVISRSRLDLFEKIGVKKDCCLRTLTCYHSLPFCDLKDKYSYVNFTDENFNSYNLENNNLSNNMYAPYFSPNFFGSEFYLFDENTQPFDKDSYERYLYTLSVENSPKRTSITDIREDIPRFPNLIANYSKN